MNSSLISQSLFVLLAVFHFSAIALLHADDRIEANRLFEVTFTAAEMHKDPFNEVSLDVLYTNPQGKTPDSLSACRISFHLQRLYLPCRSTSKFEGHSFRYMEIFSSTTKKFPAQRNY